MDIVLRPAVPADIPALAELRAGFLSELYEDMDRGLCEAGTVPFLERHLGTDMHCFVAQEGETLVSCVFLLLQERMYHPLAPLGRRGEVLNVYTLPDRRGQGIARAMMQLCIAQAQALGLDRLMLQATAMGRGLYASLGFREDKGKDTPMVLHLLDG